MLERAQTADQRLSIYRSLIWRNRLIGLLRFAVPGLGAAIFLGLLVQIYISNLGQQFGISNISINRDTVTVETPQYAGVLGDGSTYRVSAAAAQAATGQLDLIDLTGASVILNRVDGVDMTADASLARLNVSEELVMIPDEIAVGNSLGASGVLRDSVIDYPAQTLESRGGVDFTFTDGMHLQARTMLYDASTQTWQFTGAHLTIPPREEAP
jgi:lipopolysaccharide export system protein LptC